MAAKSWISVTFLDLSPDKEGMPEGQGQSNGPYKTCWRGRHCFDELEV
jgi:hypothetical protein